MGFVPKWSRGDHKKSAPKHSTQGVRQMPSLFHGAKDAQYSGPALFADGGEVSEEALKAEGLKASAGEDVGFLKRLSMGNIDDSSSEAYKRFGAGRGRSEREASAAFKQMDDIESGRQAEMNRLNDEAKSQAHKVETYPLPDNRDMDSTAQTTKPASRAPARAAEAPSKAVDYSSAPDESAAETARIVRIARATDKVKARPRMNWSTPADRARWDEKYKGRYNEDGSRKDD